MVGSVLVYENRIIGEGYHRQYGQAHAEVNCINSVAEKDKHLVSRSTLYVSLEPCAHFGKTPPCSDLIIEKGIPHVVVGCRDPFEQVNGKGIEKLRAAGVAVTVPVLEPECKQLNKRFFTFHTQHRPYIILKWAATADNRIAAPAGLSRLLISNEYTNRLVHRWRSEEAAILIGTNTALQDNPSLTNRLWTGHYPVRLVIDTQLRLPTTLQVFDRQQKTIVFNYTRQEEQHNLHYYQLENKAPLLPQILQAAHQLSIQSILVEGGAQLLQSFIDNGLWDEARTITNETLVTGSGLHAPLLSGHSLTRTEKIHNDTIRYFNNQNHND
ncbi:diaminohydroxyphosphoribosylaminopyrimidine deaminase [Russula earlei]|uniref:Diaminohydroxyphosphoribosylaminopyrimidine deaminase n=1 Tax=Russula earlei TaxID=71964 RepID=A0ACC0TR92_9AGAM|nr:diaminohydroxyphosphoribosylaminopyrimidine deaminase [Russula earlei]